MKSSKTNFSTTKLSIVFLICLLFCAANLFAVKQFVAQKFKSLNHPIIKSSNPTECQVIKFGEVPIGLDAASWEKIQEQILPLHSRGTNANPKSEIQNFSAPLYGAEVKLTASDVEADDYFGYSVAVNGDVAIVGALGEDAGGSLAGAAYVFERNEGGANAWGEVKKLTATDAQIGDYFGCSVAVAGDVAVIGAYYEDAGGNKAGAAYIFERNAGGINAWGEVKKLTASDAQADDQFGKSVAVDGDVVVVGAWYVDAGGNKAGAAYIFERNAGGTNAWGEVKKLIASTAQANAQFGNSVAVDGDVVVVGAYYKDSYTGAAYIFERNAGGINAWGEVKELVAADTPANAQFGISVAVAGDVAIVGANWDATRGYKAGAAYVFERNAGGINAWGEVKQLVASDAQASDNFGNSVAMAGDVAVVGADYEKAGGNNAGAVYIFKRNKGGANAWGEVKKLTASDAQADDFFGYSVAVAGDVAIVGTPYEDAGGSSAGAAYVIPVADETKDFCEVAKKTASDAEASDRFGWSVAVAGDVAVVGALWEDTGGVNAGAAYIFERNIGGTNAWGEVKKLTASDAEAQDYFGNSVAVAGDVAAVGAYGGEAAYVFERNAGGANAWGEVKKLIASDAVMGDQFGNSVAVAGDVVVVGAYGKNLGGFGVGAAYVFERNIGGINAWGEVKKLIASDAEPYDYFGCSVAAAGDVVVVGAFGEDAGGTNSGAAYIFERNIGGTNAWGEMKKLIASDAEADDNFGRSVAVAGDVAVVGAWRESSYTGAAYIFERNAGSVNAWTEVKKLTASDAEEYDYFGFSVAVAGDVAVVGAYHEDGEGYNNGAAYIFERNAGSANAWGEVKKLTATDAQPGDNFGCSIAVAGDVAIVGAWYNNASASEAGAAYIFSTDAACAPSLNDKFADAESLPNDSGMVSGSNTDATTEPGEPAHSGYGPFHSVWCNWSEPTSTMSIESAAGDVLLVDTHGSDFDTVLAVYTGTAVNSLTQVAANDNSGTGIDTSEVSFQFNPGVTYHIAVGGKTATDTGNVVLNYEIIPEPTFIWIFGLLELCIIGRKFSSKN